MTKTITLKELRPGLPRVMDAIDKRMERYIVTRRGRPAAIILSVDDFEGLMETLEILQDRREVARLKKAEKEIKAGQSRSLEEIHRSLTRV